MERNNRKTCHEGGGMFCIKLFDPFLTNTGVTPRDYTQYAPPYLLHIASQFFLLLGRKKVKV